MKTFVWDDTYRFREVVYAPEVPLSERQEFHVEGVLPYELRKRRFRRRWGGRAVLLADLGSLGAEHIEKAQHTCGEAWRAAKSLAGVVDLVELDHRLSEELWTLAQLELKVWLMVREGVRRNYETHAARKVIDDQITARQQQLEELRDELKAFYDEGGADLTAVSDAVRDVLMQALDEVRPIQYAVVSTRSLREIVTQYRSQADETD
ncbi:hypothetical protein [Streptomyces mutabilis]|uniref:Uncharacterized protein n=1 Tax=Streptomyces mutabilis TaxID=67332 RepID=A0A086MR21_9ACTN|nr:hypothetical protein [Streptomyces mutabilis]KFG71339.1 hypothetical protein FM21_34085 [Streptomyces mutabilis]